VKYTTPFTIAFYFTPRGSHEDGSAAPHYGVYGGGDTAPPCGSNEGAAKALLDAQALCVFVSSIPVLKDWNSVLCYLLLH
jgi:hypothetical protein